MRRHELTDFEWKVIKPLLPNKPRGVPRVNDRRVLNGILWRFTRNGAQEQDVWANIPPRSNRNGSSIFGAFLYGSRNLVDSFCNKLKEFRSVTT